MPTKPNDTQTIRERLLALRESLTTGEAARREMGGTVERLQRD
ncbi:hypothetical protein [Salinisphaera sp. PC39]